ncbi:unnamed protein product [Allacma fusca]|uniref:Uncharacterized protein n=1 Tax=Allacma fusca TaxID=39272 RepID=A0A8J2KNU2_9HEXA|nr:unnamed protein product [Allacma fusca]
MGKNNAVIEFPLEKSVELVPKSWLRKNNTKCKTADIIGLLQPRKKLLSLAFQFLDPENPIVNDFNNIPNENFIVKKLILHVLLFPQT